VIYFKLPRKRDPNLKTRATASGTKQHSAPCRASELEAAAHSQARWLARPGLLAAARPGPGDSYHSTNKPEFQVELLNSGSSMNELGSVSLYTSPGLRQRSSCAWACISSYYRSEETCIACTTRASSRCAARARWSTQAGTDRRESESGCRTRIEHPVHCQLGDESNQQHSTFPSCFKVFNN
jgi:hypothetical protein